MENTARYKNKARLLLLASFSLAPLLGSTILIFIMGLTAYVTKGNIKKKSSYIINSPIKLTGLIFILYFCTFTMLEIFHSEGLTSGIRALGKIFPIFIIGLLALLLDIKKISLTHRDISNAAIFGIYLTFGLIILFKFILPNIFLNGYDIFSEKLGLGVDERLTMLAGNALPFATLFVTLSFLTLLGIMEKSPIKKLIAVSALVIGIFTVLVWSNSRGPSLTVVPLLLISLFYISSKVQIHRIRFFSTYLTLITLILILCLYYIRGSIAHFLFVLPSSSELDLTTYEKYWHTYQTIINFKNYDLSVYTRLIMYAGSIKTFLASPIIGHGLDGMGQSILQFLPPEWAELKYRHFHNTFINHYLAAGIFGLLGLMGILFSPLLSLYFNKNRKCHDTSFCSIIIITSMICGGITNVLLMHDLIGAFFTILIVSNALASFNKRLPS